MNYLHRLGFVLKRPKKRLLKAKDEERKAFIIQYSQIREEESKKMATTPRAFISFDFDHDDDLRNALVGQSRYNNSPFNFSNWSLKEPLTGDWKKKIRDRIAPSSAQARRS